MYRTPWLVGIGVFWLAGSLALAGDALDGTQWRIELTTPSAESPSVEQIRFEERKFVIPIFEEQGFGSSHYTLTEKEDGVTIWETMQRSPDQGTISWRGDVRGDTVKGVASWQKPDGTSIIYRFTGEKVTEPIEQPEAAEEETEAEEAP